MPPKAEEAYLFGEEQGQGFETWQCLSCQIVPLHKQV